MARTDTFIHVDPDDEIEVGTNLGEIEAKIGRRSYLFLTAVQARTLASQLSAAADELDPVDDAAVARTLALATEVPA